MKDVLSLVTFVIAVVYLAMFVAMVKQIGAVWAPGEPANCIMASASTPGCDVGWRRSYVTGRHSSRPMSELLSLASSSPIVERKLTA
jgi:hypothetical protein